jgi:hypothetical protein
MPLATNEFNVGVSPRSRKSARKPSSDISNVVGAKVEVPLDQSFGRLGWRPHRRIYVPYGQEKYEKQDEHYTKGDDPRFVRDGQASVFQHLMPPLFIIRLTGSVSIYVMKIIRSRHQVAEVH